MKVLPEDPSPVQDKTRTRVLVDRVTVAIPPITTDNMAANASVFTVLSVVSPGTSMKRAPVAVLRTRTCATPTERRSKAEVALSNTPLYVAWCLV